MKKLLAILLAMVLVMVSVVAFAADGDSSHQGVDPSIDVSAAPSAEVENTFTFDKIYTITGSTAILPADSLTFTVVTKTVTDAASTVTVDNAPQIALSTIAVTEGTAVATTATFSTTLTVPAYTSVGIYTYEVTEVNSGVAGVTYYPDPLTVTISVIQGTNGLVLGGIAIKESTTKIDALENTYDAGSLDVTKTVTGNMGDQQKEFDITVTFTAADDTTVFSTISYKATGDVEGGKVGGEEASTTATTVTAGSDGWTTKSFTLTLKHGQKIEFDNIPSGVTYEISEADYSDDGYDDPTISSESGTISSEAVNITVTNNKEIKIDTGIELDVLPYVMIMVIALAAAALLVVRRRREEI